MEDAIQWFANGMSFCAGVLFMFWLTLKYGEWRMRAKRKRRESDRMEYGAYTMCPHGRTFADECFICKLKDKMKG